MAKTIDAPGSFVPQQAVAFGTGGNPAVAVDRDQPLPVESGSGSVVTASIASGAALSPPIDLDRQRLHRIVVPTGWTNAALSFQSSSDGTNWNDLYDATGEVMLGAGVVAAGRAVVVDPAVFYGIRYLQVRSGTASAPVNQAAARTLTLVTVAR